MGYPSEGKEAFYRNSIKDTAKFLNSRHPNWYRIYNLCTERKYDDRTIFDDENVVERFMFDDHNPPVFDDIFEFTKDCYDWLSRGKDYVVAIHCKAGKGRTGVMICCYLIYS